MLGNIITKLYVGIMTNLLAWSQSNQIILPNQKGFVDTEGYIQIGVYKNNFVAQSVIDNARRNRKETKETILVWLDLMNAFGSIPYQHTHNLLHSIELTSKFRNIIKYKLYTYNIRLLYMYIKNML